jgi:hypothetical protein
VFNHKKTISIMKKLSFFLVFAAMFAFVACGPATEKKVEEVQVEEVIEEATEKVDSVMEEAEVAVEEVAEEVEN